MPHATTPWLALTLTAVAMATPPVRADEARDQAVEEWCDFLGSLNASGMVEPAGSHGSLGVALGAGVSSHSVPDPNVVTASLLEREGAETGEAYVVPRMWINKGLPWPVDLGLTTGGASDRSFTQAAGYVQWTAYEAFARPAVSLRAGYGRIFGLPGTEIGSTSVEAVASFGLLRYFTAYASAGVSHHVAKVTATEEDSLAFLLTQAESGVEIERTWISTIRAAGLRVAVLPPFVALTAEAQATGDGRRAYAAKVSVGM